MKHSTLLLIVGIIFLSLNSLLFAQYHGSYDVGGSSPNFSSIVQAANLITANGLSGPVICNIWSGTFYTGQVTLSSPIPGLNAVNTLTFQNAPGNTPVARAPYFNQNVFHIDRADYITIQGLDIRDCEETAIEVMGVAGDSCKQIRIIGNYIHSIGTDSYNGSAVALSRTSDCEITGNKIDGDVCGILISNSRSALIANNMIYSCWGNTYYPGACIYTLSCPYLLVYHNSCYAGSDYVLYASSCNYSAVKNNVLYQTSSGESYAIAIYPGTSQTCDYNDLYAPSGYVGMYGVNDYQTLAQWQAASGLDLHSISANPNFSSSTNLHVNEPSPLGFAGITVADVTTDYDGETRKTPNPDIGADEFIFPLAGSYDVGGGANHFATPIAAADRAAYQGVRGALTFNVYSGTYNGQVNLPAIAGTSINNSVTFRAATGQTPIITNTSGTNQANGNGFYLTGADYITIQDFEITNTAAHGIFNSFTGTDSSSHNKFIHNYIHDIGNLGDYNGIYLLNSPDCQVLRNEIEADYNGLKLSTSARNLTANNMIYFAGLCGIYDSDGIGNRYYYNSVYQEMLPATTYNLYIYHSFDVDLKNNVLYHNGSGSNYALSIIGNLATYPLTSDYNDFFAPTSHVAYYNGNRTTLADWQSASGLDAHSLSANPNFVNLATPDLHISDPSPLSSAAVFILDVLFDFDGELRHNVHPDIGADELYGPLAGEYDVGGGAMDFNYLNEAITHLNIGGMAGPVTLNTYTGTYGGMTLTTAISGLGAANPLTIQNAPGQSPIISGYFGHGIEITNADYITIQGFEIIDCENDGIRVIGTAADSCTNIRIQNNYIHQIGQSGLAHLYNIYLYYAGNCQILENEVDGDHDAEHGIYLNYCNNILTANNMIYSCDYSGIYSGGGFYDNIYYNSVLNNVHSALYMASRGATVKNNILYQSGSGSRYAIYVVGGVTLPVASDYNDLYAPLARVGYYLTYRTSLADWQAATGLDAHSISANPNFISISAPIDLHLNEPSPAIGTGTPVAEITDDFDGDLRDELTPDIGADEFAPAGPPEAIDDLIITLSSSTDDSTNTTLFWSPVAGTVQYHVYKSTTDPNSGFVLIGSTAATTFTDTNAIIGETESFYYVTADNSPPAR